MAMRCPACGTMTLNPYRDESAGLEIDCCSDCSGLWFDPNELATFLQSNPMKQRFLWMDAEPLSGVGYVLNTKVRRCPRDKQKMSEKMFGGITLDFCTKCEGLWFDDGEVRLVVERYRRGGAHGDASVGKELREGLTEKDADDRGGGGALYALKEFVLGLVRSKK